jgi:Fur family zinc uptake transcriptional regulator
VSALSKHTASILQKADEKCTRAGTRLTVKRAALLGLLVEAARPLSAYELVALYNQSEEQTIQPMSAYRILQFLQSEELVHKLETQNKYIACSHISCSHAHQVPQFLVCRKCHKVSEINLPAGIVDELSTQAKLSGFELDESRIELDGVCKDCGLD